MNVYFLGLIQTSFINIAIKERMCVKSAVKACFCQAQNMILDQDGPHFMMLLIKLKSCSDKMHLEVSFIFSLNYILKH